MPADDKARMFRPPARVRLVTRPAVNSFSGEWPNLCCYALWSVLARSVTSQLRSKRSLSEVEVKRTLDRIYESTPYVL